jgi:hypothetical protein
VLRESREIANRALIHGALGFRASLEVTMHARCAEICGRLLPWLEELGLASRIEDYHREILKSPHGSLPPDARSEAYWRGESAAVLGWSINLFEKPQPLATIDSDLLVERLRILQPNGYELLRNSSLRPSYEVEHFCAFCLAVRNRFQLMSLGSNNRSLFDSIFKSQLDELGLENESVVPEVVIEEAAHLAAESPNVRGLFVVRAIAAEWLLGGEQ